MKTFTTKEQYIEFFTARVDYNNKTMRNRNFVRDFHQTGEKEFIFNFDEQTLSNPFKIINIEYFFTEIQAIEKIERKRLRDLEKENK